MCGHAEKRPVFFTSAVLCIVKDMHMAPIIATNEPKLRLFFWFFSRGLRTRGLNIRDYRGLASWSWVKSWDLWYALKNREHFMRHGRGAPRSAPTGSRTPQGQVNPFCSNSPIMTGFLKIACGWARGSTTWLMGDSWVTHGRGFCEAYCEDVCWRKT